ncbi:hypothetical protein [Marixanthomonas spongiae]|uniref:Uncharacterized protein n=1 Tax=Marixanthomonas spongiae TaxID=2174845 RepID=A0A2U0I2I7_9FLAO|nr:hypothetical protein [Marixanthomonas spongiae]PVW15317.1 hypothetical protein DDV96_07920 [Marixanthomonas spongiae]
MKNRFIFLIALLLQLAMYGQEEVATINGEGKFSTIKQSFNVVDETSGNFFVFLEDRDRVYGFMFDENYNILGTTICPDLHSKFKAIIGYAIESKVITLFMNTPNGRSYGAMTFDFEKGMAQAKELGFKLRGEKYLEAIHYNNDLYLLSVPNRGSQLNVYAFNNDLDHTLHEIIFKENSFLDQKGKAFDFSEIAIKSTIGQIEPNTPNVLELTSKDLKFYKKGDSLSITSDHFREHTHLIQIDLASFEHSVKKLPQPEFEGFNLSVKSNSFLMEDKLFQIASDSDKLQFQIVEISSGKIIKKIAVTDDEQLEFKNTPIIQEGGDFDSYRELEKTNKFLRKISNGGIGLSIYKQNGVYEITMGSTVEKPNNAVIVGGALGGLAGGIIVASFNNLNYTYNGYKNTKSVRITGLFDKDFNHLEGSISENPFDRIKTTFENTKGATAETIFKLNESFIWGHYNRKENNYRLVKFSE